MTELFLTLLYTGLLAGAAALVAAVLRWGFRRLRLPTALSCALWVIVLLRMVVPAGLLAQRTISPLRWAAPAAERGVQALSRAPSAAGPSPSQPAAATPPPRDALRPPTASSDTGAGRFQAPTRAPAEVLSRVWLAGALGLWAYLAISYLRLKLRLRTAVRRGAPGGPWWESGRVASPFVFGLLRPRIYLPPGLEGDTLEYVLRHERQHVRRRDYLVKLLFLAALGLHWYNPALWLAWVLMGRDLELACDEAVLKGLEGWGSPKGYSAALLSLAAPRRGAALPLGFGENGVAERIKHALRYRRPAFWVSAVLVPAAVFALVWALSCNPAFAPLPGTPPALTVELERRDPLTLEPAALSWGGEDTDSPYPEELPGGTLSADRLSPSLTLQFPEGQTPSRIEGTDYLLVDWTAVHPAALSFAGLNGVDGQYYARLNPHPASAGAGMETRMLVITCTWDNGREADTCQYAALVEVPAALPGTVLTAPLVVVDGQRLSLGADPDELSAPYGGFITVSDPQGRSGKMELGVSAAPDRTPTPITGGDVDGGTTHSSVSVPVRPAGEARQDETQYYTLTYRWADGTQDVYHFTLYAYQPPLDVDYERLRIRLTGEDGALSWMDLGTLLPAPASWAGQDLAGRDRAETLAGLLDPDHTFLSFSTNLEGWAVIGVGHGVGGADVYVYRTHDGGYTWTETGRPKDAHWYPVEFYASYGDPHTALLAIGLFVDAPVYRTRDGGETWKQLDLPLPEGAGECTGIASERELFFSLPNGRHCSVYTYDDETWHVSQPIDDPLSIPLAELPWPSYLGAEEEFSPNLTNFYYDPVKLLGFSSDRTAAVFAFDAYTTGLSGLMLCVGGRLSYYPGLDWNGGPQVIAANPVWGDFDGDGADELALPVCVGTGTGINLWDLHLFELEGGALRLAASLHAESLQALELQALDIPDLPETARLGDIVQFSAEGSLRASLGVEDAAGIHSVSYIGGLECSVVYDGHSLRLSQIKYSENTP